jgi:hypothetical protein
LARYPLEGHAVIHAALYLAAAGLFIFSLSFFVALHI